MKPIPKSTYHEVNLNNYIHNRNTTYFKDDLERLELIMKKKPKNHYYLRVSKIEEHIGSCALKIDIVNQHNQLQGSLLEITEDGKLYRYRNLENLKAIKTDSFGRILEKIK